MSTALDDARAALKERQGLGARYDAPGAPARELDWARRGTAYFARILNGLPDDALDEPSAIIGFSRRRLIAQVGYQARLFGEIVAWARSGQTAPFPKEAAVSPDDLEFGITQPSRALRYLFEHSAIHLNVEWRDLTDAVWDQSVTDIKGKSVNLRQTPLLRAKSLWQHALDLKAGGRKADLPIELR